jgi:hypothetical protein
VHRCYTVESLDFIFITSFILFCTKCHKKRPVSTLFSLLAKCVMMAFFQISVLREEKYITMSIFSKIFLSSAQNCVKYENPLFLLRKIK